MKEALKTAMMTSISEVLETMFFMTIEATDVKQWADINIDVINEKHFISRIEFSGPLSGAFIFTVPHDILSGMTEMFMGLEAGEVTETHLSGTISEAINMIAGNTFSILDDQAVFNLEIPELVDAQSLSDTDGKTEKEALYLRIETPDGRLGLQAQYSI
jgi:CheY-specific phosphatase CheX